MIFFKNQTTGSQPLAIRIFIYSNVLLWGVQIPSIGLTFHAQLLITILAGLITGLSCQKISIKILLFASLFVLYGSFAYWIGPCTDYEVKVAFSSIALLVTLISLSWLAKIVRWDVPLLTVKEASVMLGLVAFAVISEFISKFLEGNLSTELRVGGPYLEPSHLALSVSPLIYFLWISKKRQMALAFSIIFFVLAYSSTLIVMLIILLGIPLIGSLVREKGRSTKLLAITAAAIALFAFWGTLSSSGTYLRVIDLIDANDKSNLSSLVYINGWQQLHRYFINTSGVGLGLNAMGCSPLAHTEITDWLLALDLEQQNVNDGSFFLSKIGSEFGLLGILLLVLMAVFVAKRLLLLSHKTNSSEVISIGWLAIVAIGGFVRSAGYFSGPVILGIFSFFILKVNKNRQAAIFKRAMSKVAKL